jgi:hypothetical protein
MKQNSLLFDCVVIPGLATGACQCVFPCSPDAMSPALHPAWTSFTDTNSAIGMAFDGDG